MSEMLVSFTNIIIIYECWVLPCLKLTFVVKCHNILYDYILLSNDMYFIIKHCLYGCKDIVSELLTDNAFEFNTSFLWMK